MTSNRVLGTLLAAAVVCGLASCGKSRQARLENNLKEAISVYMSENLPADVSVDSIVVLHIDSLWQNMIKGVLILAVVVINAVLQRIASRNALSRREM